MSTVMQRQIDKLAATVSQIKPRAPFHSILLAVPQDDATDAVKAAYQAKFDAAQAAGVQVIGLVGVRPDPIARGWSQAEDRRSSL